MICSEISLQTQEGRLFIKSIHFKEVLHDQLKREDFFTLSQLLESKALVMLDRLDFTSEVKSEELRSLYRRISVEIHKKLMQDYSQSKSSRSQVKFPISGNQLMCLDMCSQGELLDLFEELSSFFDQVYQVTNLKFCSHLGKIQISTANENDYQKLKHFLDDYSEVLYSAFDVKFLE